MQNIPNLSSKNVPSAQASAGQIAEVPGQEGPAFKPQNVRASALLNRSYALQPLWEEELGVARGTGPSEPLREEATASPSRRGPPARGAGRRNIRYPKKILNTPPADLEGFG